MSANPGQELPAPPLCSGSSLTQLHRLFSTRYPAMVALAQLILGERAAAEEIAQEAFVRVQRRLSQIDNPEAYLRTTVVNLARSAVRRRSGVLRYLRHHQEEDQQIPDASEQLSERDAVLAMLARLPHRQREVLVLRYYLDYSENEIAHALGISVGTVKTHMSRGLTAAARLLGEEG
jgi:RNA polymerase sigma-70 factor (sigma-E family)